MRTGGYALDDGSVNSLAAAVPPHDLGLERAVLGCALYDGPAARRIAALDRRLFFLDAHGQALAALPQCLDADDTLPVSVLEWRLASGIEDPAFWAGLVEEAHVPVALPRLLAWLHELARARLVHRVR